jgi:hypothetical protein
MDGLVVTCNFSAANFVAIPSQCQDRALLPIVRSFSKSKNAEDLWLYSTLQHLLPNEWSRDEWIIGDLAAFNPITAFLLAIDG